MLGECHPCNFALVLSIPTGDWNHRQKRWA